MYNVHILCLYPIYIQGNSKAIDTNKVFPYNIPTWHRINTPIRLNA